MDLPNFIPDSMVAQDDKLPDFIPESMVVSAPEPQQGSGSIFSRDNVLGGLKGIGLAATDVFTAPADLIYRGGNYLLDAVTGQETDLAGGYPSDYAESIFNYVSGGEEDQAVADTSRLVGNLGTVVAVPSQATKLASKVPLLSKAAETSRAANFATKAVGYGAEGAGYGALFNAKNENLGNEIAQGAALNMAVPATLQVAGKAAKGSADFLKKAGSRLELSSFGVGKTQINKAIKRMPDLLDDSKNFQNPINDALESFQKSGGTQKGMSGEALYGQLQQQYDDILGTLRQELELAQGLQKADDVIIPQFNKTQEYVKGLAGTNLDDAKRIMDREIAKTVNNTDGTLLSIQDEKVKLGQAIRDTAWGDDAAGQLRVNILKRIRADLREAVESEYSRIAKRDPKIVADLNKELGKRESLFPIFRDMVASDESRTILKEGIKSLSTTGGVGQTAIAAMAGLGVGGAPVAAGAVLGNMFAQTPQGKRLIAKGLQSSALQSPLRAGALSSIFAQPSGRLAVGMESEGRNEAVSASQASSPSFANGRTESIQSPQETVRDIPSEPPQILAVNRRPFGGLFSLSQQSAPSQAPSQNPIEAAFQRMSFGPEQDSQFANDFTGESTVTEDSEVVGSLVEAVIQQESAGKPNAVSPKGAQGLMQLMPATGREMMQELGMDPRDYDPFDPELNVTLGTAYLQKLYDMFGDEELALAAYNWGMGNVRKAMRKANSSSWEGIKHLAPTETKKYVPMVLKRREKLIAQSMRATEEV